MPFQVLRKRRRTSYPGSSKRARYALTTRPKFGLRRRAYNRRRYRRRLGARTAFVQSSAKFRGIGFPRRLVMELPYRKTRVLTTGTGGASDYHTIRLNSLFDPDYTGAGQQPLFFDQVTSTSGLYRNYLVYAADVEIVIRNTSTSDIQAWFVADQVDTGAGWTPSSVFTYGERPTWHTKMVEAPTSGGPLSVYHFKRRYHMAKIFGITKKKLYSEDDYSAAYNANPSRVAYLTFGASDNPQSGIAGLTANVEVYVRYHAVFFGNANSPAQS